MASSSNKRQTMAKMARERSLKERRALKQEKKESKRAAARNGDTVASEPEAPSTEDATGTDTPS